MAQVPPISFQTPAQPSRILEWSTVRSTSTSPPTSRKSIIILGVSRTTLSSTSQEKVSVSQTYLKSCFWSELPSWPSPLNPFHFAEVSRPTSETLSPSTQSTPTPRQPQSRMLSSLKELEATGGTKQNEQQPVFKTFHLPPQGLPRSLVPLSSTARSPLATLSAMSTTIWAKQ